MTFDEFHNAMRVLFNIDADEFIQAVYGRDVKPDEDSREWKQWEFFRDHPHEWFIRVSTADAQAIWRIMQGRVGVPRYPNGAPMYAGDGMMLDENGNRSVFDDVDQ